MWNADELNLAFEHFLGLKSELWAYPFDLFSLNVRKLIWEIGHGKEVLKYSFDLIDNFHLNDFECLHDVMNHFLEGSCEDCFEAGTGHKSTDGLIV